MDTEAARAIGLAGKFEGEFEVIRTSFLGMLQAGPQVPEMLSVMPRAMQASGGILMALLDLALILGASFAAAWLWWRRADIHKNLLLERAAKAQFYSSWRSLGDGLAWVIVELLGIAAYGVTAAAIMLFFWRDDPELRLFLLTYVIAGAIVLIVMSVFDLCFPRAQVAYRLFQLSDRRMPRARRAVLAMSIIWAFGFGTCQLLQGLGAEPLPLMLTINVIALVFCGMAIKLVFLFGQPVGNAIRGPESDVASISYLRVFFAANWHVMVSIYVVAVLFLGLGRQLLAGMPVKGTTSGALSILLLLAAPAIAILFERFITAQFGSDSPLSRTVRRTFRILLTVAAAAIFVEIWDLQIDASDGGFLRALLGGAFDLGVVLLMGYAVWQLISGYIDNAQEKALRSSEDRGEATRIATILPLLRLFAMGAVFVITMMTLLSSLGVDIAPLLAGAGVIGVALGFGAQTLVRDIVSGLFFLMDDAFRSNEYIDVGAASGWVEKISVRSLRLRNRDGSLHTVPFGEIKTLSNFSRDWVVMKIPLRISHEVDVESVNRLIDAAGEALYADETYRPMLLGRPESLGVVEISDANLLIHIQVRARPQRQYILRQELLRRIHEGFVRQGIKLGARGVAVDAAPGVRAT